MNKHPEKKKLQKLSDEAFDFKQITWNVSDELLPDLDGFGLQSPTFSFVGGTWALVIWPYGAPGEESEGFIDLQIVRLNFLIPEQVIFFKFCFITKQGKEYRSYSSFFNMTPTSSYAGVKGYVKKSTFWNEKNFLAPNGDLTIMCQIRTKKVAVVDRHCQIESTASFLESSVQISKQEAESSGTACKESPKKDSGEEPGSSKTSHCIGCNCGLIQSAPLATNKTLRDFKELFLKQEDCDVIIKVKHQEFQAHKAILIARSPVFASTFRNDMKEKSTGIIDIEDCDPSSFSDFLCFLYCGTAEILTTENVFSLFTAADKYDIEDLQSECLEFMKRNLSLDTFCETLTLALLHLEKELIDLVTDFFAKHFHEIIVTVKWQWFVIDYPVQSNEIMIKALVPKKK